SHFNGEPRLYVEIGRNINADEIKSTQIAREQLKKINAQFPQLNFHEIDAPADYTQASLNGVWQSLGEGILLTAIVMLLFLHAWRNAAVVMLAIPTSILSTMVLMKAFGFHLDIMSLMGLSLIIGILVDDSIVVLENITRHRDQGEDPINAAINGRTEIGSAAIAITMVDVVVFLPIAFLSGIVGKFLKEFALVVVVATLFSLFVSFTLTPLLAAKWSVRKRSGAPPRWLEITKHPWLNVGLAALAIGAWFTPWLFARLIGVFVLAVLLLNAFVQRYDEILESYRTKLLPMAMRHGFFVVFVCAMLFMNAILLLGGGTTSLGFDIIVLVLLGVGLLAGFLLRKFAPNGFAPLAQQLRDSNGDTRFIRDKKAILWAAVTGVVTLIVAAVLSRVAPMLAVLLVLAVAGWLVARRFAPAKNLVRTQIRALRDFGTRRRATILWFVVPVALAIVAPLLGQISFDFVPNTQTGHVAMTVTYPPGTPIDTTARYVNRLENAILKVDGVETISSTVGRKPFGWGSAVGGNYAKLDAETFKNRRNETNRVIDDIRKLAYLVPGGKFQVQGDTGGGSGQAIFYALQGPEDAIGAGAEKVAQFLRDTPGSVNVQTSNEVAAPRLNVQIDASKAAILGVSPGAAATAARIAVDGAVATKVRTPDGLVDVRVQFPSQDRNTVESIKSVRVRASDGTLVPLADLATFTWTKAPTKIDRLNRERVVNVIGDTLPGYSLGAVTAPLEAKLRQPGFLPAGVRLQAQGDTQYLQQTMVDMGIALTTSFMLVYMLMVVLYGSFLEPLIVMFSVPVAVVGAFMALALMHRIQPDAGQSLNLLSMLGIVMLFGLVSKNGILLVDYSNTLCKRGMRVHDAVLQAAATRFRPILMTTFAMVFGMLPLAFGFAEGAEWRQAMGTVIIGGLLSSLILTLFLVPMIYNTWIGYLERRADQKAMRAELREPVLTT
ncbi:MAG: efflux RND transporter permease subunit, partial [Candidatus Eremiobacteraeota bacterium]|nr:efflux RND transporter permease subunit [Candidatus Eremiobacteraeota bacterium]